MPILHADPASSSSLRVLCWLRFKQIDDVTVAPLRIMAGEHLSDAYAAGNPSRSVPALELELQQGDHEEMVTASGPGDRHDSSNNTNSPNTTHPDNDHHRSVWLTQSLAILEYLEALYPLPATLPVDPLERARIVSLCNVVACDIHPLSNLRVRLDIATRFGSDDAKAWCRDWTMRGLTSLESWLATKNGLYSHGNDVTMADFFVAPAVLNALRFGCSLDTLPTLRGVYEACLALPAFDACRFTQKPTAM